MKKRYLLFSLVLILFISGCELVEEGPLLSKSVDIEESFEVGTEKEVIFEKNQNKNKISLTCVDIKGKLDNKDCENNLNICMRLYEEYLLYGCHDMVKYDEKTFIVRFKDSVDTTQIVSKPGFVSLKDASLPASINNLASEHNVGTVKRLSKISNLIPISSKLFVFGLDGDLVKAIEEFNEDNNVEYAQFNYIYKLDVESTDPLFSIMWPLDNTGQDYISFREPSSPGAFDADIDLPESLGVDFEVIDDPIIAVIDTGVDYNHEDLKESMWVNVDEIPDNGIDDDSNGYVDDYRGYDFVECEFFFFGLCLVPVSINEDPFDPHGHGTHASGTIAAEMNNGVGISGICPNCKIMPIRFLNLYGGGLTDWAIDSIIYSVDNGADILSNSWGGYGFDQALNETIQQANDAGLIVVAAAGNSNVDTIEYPHYPSSYENVVSVAATNNMDQKADFSNYGLDIDLSAPGVDILSLRAEDTDMYGGSGHIVGEDGIWDSDGKYYVSSGTSMATPHVAGLFGLFLSKNSVSNLVAINSIKNYVDNLDFLNPHYKNLLGSGRINSFYLLNETIPDSNIRILTSFPEILEVGTQYSFDILVENSGLVVSRDINLSFEVNGNILDSQIISSLSPGESMTLYFEWTPNKIKYNEVIFSALGNYNELYLADNYVKGKTWVYNYYQGFEITNNDYIFDCDTTNNPEGRPIDGIIGPLFFNSNISYGIKMVDIGGITIRNCEISGFNSGIISDNILNLNISNNEFNNNYYSIFLNFSNNFRISDNIIRENVYGILSRSSINGFIINNNISEHIFFRKTEFEEDGTPFTIRYGGRGIELKSGNSRISVEDNLINHNPSWGIGFFNSDFINISNNIFEFNGVAVNSRNSFDVSILGNEILNSNTALWFSDSYNVVIANNELNKNGGGIGITNPLNISIFNNEVKTKRWGTGMDIYLENPGWIEIYDNSFCNGYYDFDCSEDVNNFLVSGSGNYINVVDGKCDYTGDWPVYREHFLTCDDMQKSNLMKNPSFEVDSGIDFYSSWEGEDSSRNNFRPDGWFTKESWPGIIDKSQGSMLPAEFYDGYNSLMIYVENGTSYSGQDIPINYGKKYRVEGYVKTNCENDDCFGTILSECLERDHTNIWGYNNCKLNINSNDIIRLYGDTDWTKVMFSVEADNPNAKFLKVLCYNSPNANGIGTVWCDDFKVEEIKEITDYEFEEPTLSDERNIFEKFIDWLF